MAALHQTDMRELLRGIQQETKPFASLRFINQLKVSWEIFRLQTRIIFSQKFAWFMFALVAYCVFLYIVNYFQEIYNRFDLDALFHLLMTMPLSVLAVLINMSLIANENSNRSLELSFTIAGSRYKVWLLRFASLSILLFAITIGLSLVAFFFFTDVPIFGLAIHSFIPTFCISGMAFYFSVKFKSGLGAGMAAGLVISLTILFGDALDDTKYFLYFNPYWVPWRVDAAVWHDWMWQNRIGLIVLGCVFNFFALRGMNNREKLLR